jgi:uncharacterized membrane protein
MVIATWIAGLVVLAIGVWCARRIVAESRGLDRIVALGHAFFAAPLAVFGAEHLCGDKGILSLIPEYMPWRVFWLYFVGVALVAAALSIATGILVRWSGLLVGILMFLFVTLLWIPGSLADPHNRIGWVIVCRESSFGAGAWALAGGAVPGWGPRARRILVTLARVLVGAAAVFFGVQHFLHPVNAPGVPLVKVLPEGIPARAAIGYLTGAMLLLCGVGILANRRTRMLATCLGSWLVLLVIAIYGPLLIGSIFAPEAKAKIEGINYFYDTLLYAGAVLGLASASAPPTAAARTAERPAA